MANTFSGTNLELYKITDVDQVIGLTSTKNSNLKLRVLNTSIDSKIMCKCVQVYNKLHDTVIISLLCKCVDDDEGYVIGVSSNDEIERILKSFGFNVEFDSVDLIDEHTLDFLKAINSIGYKFLQFTKSSGAVVFFEDMIDGVCASRMTGYDLCDFSKLDHSQIYSIENLIRQASTK